MLPISFHPALSSPASAQSVSERIAAVRFPLICGVVLLHGTFENATLNGAHPTSGHWLNWLLLWAGDLVPRGAVPLLTAISGYLFFHDFDGRRSSHLRKLRERTRTLALPYLLWNLSTLTFFLVGLALPATAAFFGGHGAAIAQDSAGDHIAWLFGAHGNPPAFQFWFIRNLIVAAVLAPLIHRALETAGLALCVGLTLLWLTGWDPIANWHMLYTLVFFTWGAWLQLRRFDLTAGDRYLGPVLALFIPLTIATLYIYGGKPVEPHGGIVSVVRLVGCVAIWLLCGWFQHRAPTCVRKLVSFAPYAFFLFAAHEPLLRILVRVANSTVRSDWLLRSGALGLLASAAVIGALTLAAALLQRHARPVYSLFAGQSPNARRPHA